MYSYTNFILILYIIGVWETTLIKACTIQSVRKLRDHHAPEEPGGIFTSLEDSALSTSHENSIKDGIGEIRVSFLRILKKMTNIIPVPQRRPAISFILNLLQLTMGFLTFILDNYTPYLVPVLWNVITGLFSKLGASSALDFASGVTSVTLFKSSLSSEQGRSMTTDMEWR